MKRKNSIVKKIDNRNDLFNLMNDNKDKTIVMKMYAEWCGASKHYKPTFENVCKINNEKNKDFICVEIDADKNRDFNNEVNLQSFPTTVYIKDNEILGSSSGSLPKEILEKQIDLILNYVKKNKINKK